MLNAVRPFIDFYRVASFSRSSPPNHYFRRFWQTLVHGWQAACRYRRLERMSAGELRMRGLDRASIGRHAFFDQPPFGRD